MLFDAGDSRYASLRSPGGTWQRPAELSLSDAGPGSAAIAPDGVLWAVAGNPAVPTGTAGAAWSVSKMSGSSTTPIVPAGPNGLGTNGHN